MTVHRLRIFHSKNGSDSFHNWLSQWLTNMEPWTDPEVTNEVPTLRDPIDDSNTSYYSGDLPFDWSEDKAIILDNIDQYAAAYCDWHRIGYHVCPHDGDTLSRTEQHELSANTTVSLERTPTSDGVFIDGYGGEYTLSGRELSIPDGVMIQSDTYPVSYHTKQCSWEENRENGTVPSHVSTL